jgi:hypothetical protein
MSTNTYKVGDIITIRDDSNNPIRCKIDFVASSIGTLPKYFVSGIDFPYMEWVKIKDIISTQDDSLGATNSSPVKLGYKSIWFGLLSK